MVRQFTLCLQIAICGQLIVSCESSCRTQHIHHSIGVRPLLCNCRYTVPRLENSSTGGGGGGGMAGWRDGARPSSALAVTIIKNIAWLNKNQRYRRYTGGREGASLPRVKPWLWRLLGLRLLIAARI